MTKRKTQPSHHYEVTGAIDTTAALSPNSKVSVDLKQLAVGAGVLVMFGIGYAYIVNGQSNQGRAIEDIQKKQDVLSAQALAASKEQEAKREALGKEFLASNKEIAKSINDLTTQITVQQNQLKITSDTMAKIVDQLSASPLRRK